MTKIYAVELRNGAVDKEIRYFLNKENAELLLTKVAVELAEAKKLWAQGKMACVRWEHAEMKVIKTED